MTRRNARVSLRWLFIIMATFGLMVACSPPQPQADDNVPEGVRIQTFDIRAGYCIVATHDAAQGVSVAMWCTN